MCGRVDVRALVNKSEHAPFLCCINGDMLDHACEGGKGYISRLFLRLHSSARSYSGCKYDLSFDTSIQLLCLHPECTPAGSLPLLLLCLWPCSTENCSNFSGGLEADVEVVLTLQEVGRPSSHAAVNIRLARLDVVVKVIAKGLNVRDDLVSSLFCKMAWEQDCSVVSVILLA